MPRIAEETIQRVAEASDIVAVIGDYFPLRRAGTSFRALCPFHREKSPSFHVNPQRQSYHCFGCGAGGTVFRFVMEYEHVDFPTAVRRLAQRAGIPIIEEEASPEENQRQEMRKRLLALHAEAATWFHQNLLKTADAAPARDYLKSRAINAEIAKAWQLGYAPDSWDALLDFLRGKRFSLEEIAQSGLASSRDDNPASQNLYARFRGRVMFPIRNDYGEVIAFSGRVLDPEAKTAKYVNSPETPLFTKGRVLYGLDKSKRALIESTTAIVCEGQLDLISAFESGVQNVIAPQGTAFTPEQARLLRRFVETVVLCFDSDRAGQEAVTRSLPALLEHGVTVKVARLPEGEDPDSLIRGRGAAAFRAVVDQAQNFFDYALTRLAERGTLNDPEGKADAARRLGPYVAAIKEQVLREATIKKVCARLGIAEAAFTPHLKPVAAPGAEESAEAGPRPVEALPMDQPVRLLCRLAVIHPEVRVWLRGQKPAPGMAGRPGWPLLEKILRSELPLENPASLAAFVAELPPAEERAIALLDLGRPPEDPLQVAMANWQGLFAQQIDQQVNAAKTVQAGSKMDSRQNYELMMKVLQEKLHSASAQLQGQGDNLSVQQRAGLEDVVENLNKQILDLQSRMNEG